MSLRAPRHVCIGLDWIVLDPPALKERSERGKFYCAGLCVTHTCLFFTIDSLCMSGLWASPTSLRSSLLLKETEIIDPERETRFTVIRLCWGGSSGSRRC